MKNAAATFILTIFTAFTLCGTVTAAEYKITWKNELPNPRGLIGCDRTITGYPTSGPNTVIKPRSELRFGYANSPILEAVKYSPPLGCAKIRVDIMCAYKDGDVTEFMTSRDIQPCRSTTAHIKLYRVDVD